MRRWCRYRVTQWLAGTTILVLAGCSGLPIDLSENEPGASGFAAQAPDELLVGLAVSEGGSRAAKLLRRTLGLGWAGGSWKDPAGPGLHPDRLQDLHLPCRSAVSVGRGRGGQGT